MKFPTHYHFNYQQRLALWSSMRRLRVFTPMDLEASSELGAAFVQRWLMLCNKAGFAQPVPTPQERPTRKADRRSKKWTIKRDIGPVPPNQKGAALVDVSADPTAMDPEAQLVQLPRSEYEFALKCVRACAGMQDPEAEIARLRNAAGVL